MSDWKAGTMTAEDFLKKFKLKGVSEDEAYSEGSTTGTKQVSNLGTYLTEDDYNRLKDSDDVKAAYGALRGEEAAEKKFSGGDGLSINTLDALFDDLAAEQNEEPKEEKTEPEYMPVQLSDKAAQSLATEETYEDARRTAPGKGGLTDIIFGGGGIGNMMSGSTGDQDKAIQTYSKNYKDNVKKFLEPGGSQGAYIGSGGDAGDPDFTYKQSKQDKEDGLISYKKKPEDRRSTIAKAAVGQGFGFRTDDEDSKLTVG